jgi:hypothetical protein
MRLPDMGTIRTDNRIHGGIMRWLMTLALLLSLSAASSWSAPSLAGDSSSSSTAPDQPASAGASASPSATWERLDDLLNQLESSARDSNADSKLLKASLRDAQGTLIELSTRLAESATRASELSSSLERCARSLELSEASLKEARAAASRREVELWLWRGAAVVGVVAGAVGLGYGLAH